MVPSLPPRSRRWHRLLLLGYLGLVLVACTDLKVSTPVPKRTPLPGEAAQALLPTRPPASRSKQTWLIMLYSDADDEILEEDMFNDFNEAEMVGSSDRVQVVAQMDRFEGGFDGDGDWTSTKRFYIEQDADLNTINSQEVADLGEVNMADGATLIDFVTWAAAAYPADNYVLIMSDHGAGWPGGWIDPAPAPTGRASIPLAESFGDMLFLMELREALAQIIAATNIGQFALIGFDACLMSQLEVYTAIAPYARYAVASQEVEPSLGWAYAAILGRLVDSPEIDAAELSRAIVNSYIEQDQQILDDRARARYLERVYEYKDKEALSAEEIAAEESKQITLVSVDLATIAPLNEALNALVRTLVSVNQKDVASARRYALAFESVFDPELPKPYIDLGNFARLLKKKIDDPAVDGAVDALLKAIDRTVIDEKHGSEKAGATGIAIHFPNAALYSDALVGYKSYNQVASAFVQESLWDDFLAFHYRKKPLPVTTEPQSSTPTPHASSSAEEVSGPGAEAIDVAPVTLSAPTLGRRESVLMQSSVSGESIAFIYLFIGFLDPATGAIQVVDMDFLDAENTKEVDGVFYPDWGEARTIAIEFAWDGKLFAIKPDGSSEIALLNPEDYGASSEEATYTVEGIYTTAKGKKPRHALLFFQNGELIQVLANPGKQNTGSLREITPKPGDRFTILEQWISSSDQNDQAEFFTQEGATLIFGEKNFVWKNLVAPKGEYLVGFIAEDLDGNKYKSYTTLTLK